MMKTYAIKSPVVQRPETGPRRRVEMYCADCGKPLPADAQFCPTCGRNNGSTLAAPGGAEVASAPPPAPVTRVAFNPPTFTPLTRAVGRWMLGAAVGLIATTLCSGITFLPLFFRASFGAIGIFHIAIGVGSALSVGLSPGKAWNRAWPIVGLAALAALIDLVDSWGSITDRWSALAIFTVLLLLSIVGFSETGKRHRWVNMVPNLPWYRQQELLVALLPAAGLLAGLAILTLASL